MGQLSLMRAGAQWQQRYHLAICLAIIFSSLFWSNSTAPIKGSLFHHLLCSPCCYTALSDSDTYNYHSCYGRWVSPRTLLCSIEAKPACLPLHCPLNSLWCTMHNAWDIIALRTFDSSVFSLQSNSCLLKLGVHAWHKTSQNQEMVHSKCCDSGCTHLDQGWIFQVSWSAGVSHYIALNSEIIQCTSGSPEAHYLPIFEELVHSSSLGWLTKSWNAQRDSLSIKSSNWNWISWSAA